MGPSFKRTLNKKPKEMQEAIGKCIKRLADDPRHPGLHTHKVRGHKGIFEAYIDDGNRLTFEYRDGGVIWLRNNCNHDILKRP